MAALSRRAILGAVGVAVAVPTPTVAAQGVPDPWEALIAGLAVLHPELPAKAREARAQGYHPADCLRVMSDPPELWFRRTFH